MVNTQELVRKIKGPVHATVAAATITGVGLLSGGCTPPSKSEIMHPSKPDLATTLTVRPPQGEYKVVPLNEGPSVLSSDKKEGVGQNQGSLKQGRENLNANINDRILWKYLELNKDEVEKFLNGESPENFDSFAVIDGIIVAKNGKYGVGEENLENIREALEVVDAVDPEGKKYINAIASDKSGRGLLGVGVDKFNYARGLVVADGLKYPHQKLNYEWAGGIFTGIYISIPSSDAPKEDLVTWIKGKAFPDNAMSRFIVKEIEASLRPEPEKAKDRY